MILDFIKNIVFGFNWELEKITPEYLMRKKSLMTKEKYVRWLRKQITICQSEISMIENTGKSVPQALLDKYKIIKLELEKTEEIFKKVAL
ncbi:MAG: hypothetical protein KAS78_02645 [Candidatus Pacebacteria bacterium]|nr:hypothetical protein [Candidatus Paceibacterota bacterium]